MAKKTNADVSASATPAKRTPEEKAQRRTDKANQRATKSLTDDRAEKKASQKQTLKTAAKELQKELDKRMGEVVARIRKETKAKLKEVVKDATRRLDVDTERMFEQALHTIVRHYDSIAPGQPAAAGQPDVATGDEAAESPAAGKPGPRLNKDGSSRKSYGARKAAAETAPAKKRAGRPAGSSSKPSPATGRGPGRPKRQPATETAEGAPELSTPAGTANDSVAVDNV